MIRLLLDQGLPHTTVKHLDKSGWDVQHVSDLGLDRATDREILNAARNDSRTVVTLDADFTCHAGTGWRIFPVCNSNS